jgi:hypothetical protein
VSPKSNSGPSWSNWPKERRKMIEIQHFYNKCTTVLSQGVDPTHCGVHPMWDGCCTLVVKVLYENHFSPKKPMKTRSIIRVSKIPYRILWISSVTKTGGMQSWNISEHLCSRIQEERLQNDHIQLVPRMDFLGLPRGDMDETCWNVSFGYCSQDYGIRFDP